MLDSAQNQRRGALDFEGYYDSACATQGSCPVAAVKVHLSRGMLDFNGDHVHLTDWTPILNALSINKQLHHIAIKSTHLSTVGAQGAVKWSVRRKTPALHSRSVTLALSRAVQRCLCVSERLHTLHLNGLPLREKDLTALTKGLVKSSSLENLSLAQCPIADQGLEIICQSVKYSPSIKTLDFSNCNITWQGAEHLANIIKHQAVRRHGTAWAESLRYRKAEFEGMSGLRRITLNGNILIGDQGAAALARELSDDLWVKAVDLQRCGLSDAGARSLLQVLQSNRCLHVLDIRNNPLVECSLVKDLLTQVLMNTNGQDSQYMWIKPQTTREAPKGRGGRWSSAGKIRRGSSKASQVSGTSRPASSGFPWRTAARAGKKRGATSATPDYSFQGAASVKVTMETESETDPEETEESESQTSEAVNGQEQISSSQYNRLKVELEECRLRLTEERNARLRANSRLVELELENAHLRNMNESLSEMVENPANSALADDTVLDSIESSFSKFHAFLNLLSDAGLGQLASLVGIDQSDFSVMGRPQLSSTGRGIEGGAGDLEAVSMQKPTGPGAPGSPRSLPLSSPSPEPQPGPSRLAAAPAGAQVEVHDEHYYLSSPAPEIVHSQQSTPLSVGSSSDGSTSGKRGKPYGSRSSRSHRNGLKDNDTHSNSSHGSGPKGRGSRSNGSPISIKRNDSSDSSGQSDVLQQYSSHSNGSNGKGSKGLYARHFTGAEGEGGAAQLLESLSLTS